MIIVKIHNGLGNQMFQYAFYRSLLEQYKYVKLDIRAFSRRKYHQGYELGRIFNVKESFANDLECDLLCNDRYNFFDRKLNQIYRNIFKRRLINKNTHIYEDALQEPIDFMSIHNSLEVEGLYLDGFWQNEKYSSNVTNILKSDFEFKVPLSKNNAILRDNIFACNAVSVHVRRGDFLKNPSFANAFDKGKYYNESIAYIESKIENPRYYVFSDDIVWCKENLKLNNAIYVDWNLGSESYNDMYLMSICKHNIVANSTFSWWAAYLNSNANKIVVAPKEYGYKIRIPSDWVRV